MEKEKKQREQSKAKKQVGKTKKKESARKSFSNKLSSLKRKQTSKKSGNLAENRKVNSEANHINTTELLTELNRLRAAIDVRGIGFWDWKIKTNTVYYSPGWKKILGFTDEEFQNQSDEWILRIHPDDDERVKQEFSSFLKGETELFESLHRLKEKNGNYIWLQCKAMIIEREPDGSPLRVIGTHTKCRRQNELEKSLLQERELFDFGPTIVWIWKNESGWPISYVSKNVEIILGYKSEELTSGSILFANLVHPDDLERVAAEVKENTLKKLQKFEQLYRIRTKYGSFIWVKDFTTVLYNPDDTVLEYQGYTIDITDLKNAEAEIQKQQKRYETIMRSSTDAIHILDKRGKLIECNDAFLKHLGYTAEEAKGLSVDMWDMRWSKEELLERIIKIMPTSELFETVHKRKDGTLRNVEISASGIEINGEKYLLNAARDITERKAEQLRLIESEERFRTMFENHSSLMILIDSETGNLIDANKAAQKFYGYTHDEFKKMHISDINGLTREESQKRIDAIVNNKLNHLFLVHTLKSGEKRDVEIFTTHIKFQQKKVLFSIIFDITEKKRIEKQNHLLLAAMDSAANSIVICNREGVVEWANFSFATHMGFYVQECIGKPLEEILCCVELSPEENKSLWQEIFSGKLWHNEMKLKRKDDSILFADVTITPLQNDVHQTEHFIAILTDITERKIIQHEILEAKERALEAHKMKSALFANMSHEIRTPLIGILGYAEILQDKLKDSEELRMVGNIFKAGKRLLETLNLVLDYSRLEAEKFEIVLKKTEVIEIIRECATLFEKMAEKKGLQLIFDPHIDRMEMMIDDRILVEILNNLINNAVKYTEKGFIVVTVEESVEHLGRFLVIKIKDTGIGIHKEKIDLIFEEFRQVSEGISRAFEGTGLGLTITKKFVQKLNGYITVESEIGKGSEFTVKLPVYDTDFTHQSQLSEDKSKHDYSHPVQEDKPSLILLVENDIINSEVITSYLAGTYICEVAHDAQAAIELIHKKRYDLFLMDINLGRGMNGLELTKYIRELPAYKNTPVIAVTAFAMRGDREEFLAAGCTDYISKPFLRENLITLIKKYL